MGVDPTPHAALLIDFDNVTMGMRSDLSKELKSLLDSDVIKGKVSVQRAYADWRRYPQYIVPLSEASVDLIFAPAYGSSKKNATDIRMAIDALELIFIRPEIGTYILLTGDSDFSSLVLKLKEYGKYVIGVGIQESSSDILVQNCDEYYSYTSLTGLTKTTDLSRNVSDPWVLVKDAVAKMVSRGDVMRSDRLKQVMQEIDPTFDEGSIGFSKFSKFLTEARVRGLVDLRKLENGQYEVGIGKGRGARPRGEDSRGRRDRVHGGGRRDRPSRTEGGSVASRGSISSESTRDGSEVGLSLRGGYDVLVASLAALRASGRTVVRDSDVKRKILERDSQFDEGGLGFTKFSLFLIQAADHGVVNIERTPTGNLDVSLPEVVMAAADPEPTPDVATASDALEAVIPSDGSDVDGQTVIDVSPPDVGQSGLRLGPRRGSTRRRGGEEGPSFLAGQTFGSDDPTAEKEVAVRDVPALSNSLQERPAEGRESSVLGARHRSAVDGIGLPTDPGAIVRYLAHRYKGVGEKTAETLVKQLGDDLFATLHADPESISRIVPPKRAEQVLDAWRSDFERRVTSTSVGRSGDKGTGEPRGDGRSRGQESN